MGARNPWEASGKRKKRRSKIQDVEEKAGIRGIRDSYLRLDVAREETKKNTEKIVFSYKYVKVLRK